MNKKKVSAILPYGTPIMLSLGFAADVKGIPADFSYFDIVPYCFHGIMLLLLFVLSILSDIGRRFVEEGEA